MSLSVRSRVLRLSSRRFVLSASIALAGAAALLTAPRAQAITTNWTNVNGGTWNTLGNWNNGIPGAAGDIVSINADISASRTVTLDVSETVGSLTIGDSNTSNSYMLNATGGSILTFNNNAATATLTMSSSSTGDQITVPIQLAGNLTVTNNNSTNTFTLNGSSIASSTSGTKILTTAGSAGTIALSAAIGGGTGDISITKTGNNNLILSGTNTFGAGVTLSAGTLTLNNATALGAASSALTINGGTLAGNATLTNANAINWNANFTFGGTTNLNLGTAVTTLNGSRTLTLNAAAGATLTFSTGIGQSTASTVTFANSGTQIMNAVLLNGTNTYTGGTVINGGSIAFGSLAAIPATSNITVDTHGALQVTGAYSTLAGWMGDTHLSKSSGGALALVADSSENFDPVSAGFTNNLSLGASVGKTVTYTGTFTGNPNYNIGGGGGTIIFSNANAFTGDATVIAGHGGGGTAVIGNSNDNLTGEVIADSGTLQIGNGGTTGSFNGASDFLTFGTLAFNRSDNLTITTPISGSGGLTKFGTNTLTIGNANTYTGPTSLAGGTLTFSVAQNLSGALAFGSSVGGNVVGNLNLTAANATFGSLVVQTNTATSNTATIASGRTLTINGNVTVGYDLGSVPTSQTATSKLIISGAGALVVTGVSSIVSVGTNQTTQLGTPTVNTLDLSGLGSVTFGTTASPINEVRVAALGQTAAGTLLLSNTANTLVVNNLQVGNSNGVVGGTGVLTLGTGTNVIQANNINIGLSKNNGTIAFASTTAGSPGTVVIGNKAGTGGANITVGSHNGTGTAAQLTGTLDLRGHNAAVNAATLTVGNNNNAGSSGFANGVVLFDTGTFNATTVSLGLKSLNGTGSNIANAITVSGTGIFTVSGATNISGNTATVAANVTSALNISGGSYTTGTLSGASMTGTGGGVATGNINVTGGALNITGNTFVLATQGTSGTAVGTLNITGGTVTTAADITDGSGATTTTITLDGGALNLTGHNIGSAATAIDTVNVKSGTLSNVNQINGTGGLTKVAGAGSNTLVLAGTNNYAGATTVNSGTVFVNGSINGSTVTTATGTSLGGNGHINLNAGQNVLIGDTSTLAPGMNSYGTLTVSGGDGVTLNSGILAIDVTDSNQDRLTIDGGALSDLDITGSSTLKLNAGKPGTFTIASWTGTRTGFFNLISVNGGSESFSSNTVGNITTYTFNSGHGSLVYDDDAKDIVVTLSIPEPASVLSLGGGCVALLGLTRPRRRRE